MDRGTEQLVESVRARMLSSRARLRCVQTYLRVDTLWKGAGRRNGPGAVGRGGMSHDGDVDEKEVGQGARGRRERKQGHLNVLRLSPAMEIASWQRSFDVRIGEVLGMAPIYESG